MRESIRSPQFIERVRRGVARFCRSRKLPIEQEDLAQSVYLAFLEGGRNKSTIEQVIIDQFRQIFGRHGQTSKYTQVRRNSRAPVSFEGLKCDTWMHTVDIEMDHKIELMELMESLDPDGDDVVMFILLCRGYTIKEIAKGLGISFQAMHLRFHRLRHLLRRRQVKLYNRVS